VVSSNGLHVCLKLTHVLLKRIPLHEPFVHVRCNCVDGGGVGFGVDSKHL